MGGVTAQRRDHDVAGPLHASAAQHNTSANGVRHFRHTAATSASASALAAATRQHPSLALGMSPRATLSLQRVARARAAARGRGHVLPDDIKAMARPVLAHRLIPTPEARLRGTAPEVPRLESVPVVPWPQWTAERMGRSTSIFDLQSASGRSSFESSGQAR